MKTDYVHVTEVSGDDVSQEQVQRMFTRYEFARQYCEGKDVLEVACGSGQGLGLLAKSARFVVGSDYSWPLLKTASAHYTDRIPLLRIDGQMLPFKEESLDVVILYEAIYYLKEPESFVRDCLRVLRNGGKIIVCNANKELRDFNPSPHSYRYFSPCDFAELFRPHGLQAQCFGDCEVDYDNPKQRVLSLVKKTMVLFDLMPKTMAGKKIFKRVVFGNLVPLPAELTEESAVCTLPCEVDMDKPNRRHKVIFVVGEKKENSRKKAQKAQE